MQTDKTNDIMGERMCRGKCDADAICRGLVMSDDGWFRFSYFAAATSVDV
jgi:hypothetical protein